MNRILLVSLAAIGPVCVGLLRFVLPYYTADNNEVAAAEVAADPGLQSLVLWLGLGAMLTLVPGLYALRPHLPGGKLRSIGFPLAIIGYLCLPGLLATDMLLWLGADQNLDTAVVAKLVDGLHPSALVATGLFVPTHIVGIVLLGVLALRSRLVPPAVAWAMIVSQPLHLASVITGLPWLDLCAWTMTALGMAWLAWAHAAWNGARRAAGSMVATHEVPA